MSEYILRHRDVAPAVIDGFEAAIKAALPSRSQLVVLHGVVMIDALLGITAPVRAYELITGDRRDHVDLRVLADVLGVDVPEVLR